MSSYAQFIEVILPLPLAGTFTYRVPRNLEQETQVGKRVTVPFGRRKLYTGIIYEIHDRPPTNYQAKYVDDVLDEQPVIFNNQLAFWDWMRQYYMCHLGDVMNAAIPSGLKLSSESRLTIHPDFDGSMDDLEDEENDILEALQHTDFLTKEGRQKAFSNLQKHGIEGIIAIGGDGTFAGAKVFTEEHQIPFIGLPGTIDNDLIGTDYTIGYDTALNNVIEAVDKIKDTAASHDRLFFVEVMGRDAGFIALRSGIGVGAAAILIPEVHTDLHQLIENLKAAYTRKKSSSIIMVAEGDDAGGAYKIAAQVVKALPQYDTRVSILGHQQRGGSPSALDRMLASQLGYEAVISLLSGKHSVMVGIVNKEVCYTPFEQAIKHHDKVNPSFLKLAEILAA